MRIVINSDLLVYLMLMLVPLILMLYLIIAQCFEKLKRNLRFLYNKWILRMCPHFCKRCCFKKEMYKYCYDDMSKKI